LGFLHRDMLGSAAQDALDSLAVGNLSGPVQLLEGYALFRLDGRRAAELNPFEMVRERAAALLLRETRDANWQAFTAKLRSAAEVKINDKYLAVQGSAGSGHPLLPMASQSN